MKTVHRQVAVLHPREARIEVDRGMQPLLRCLWALGHRHDHVLRGFAGVGLDRVHTRP
jgi:hypothetical protein